MQPPPPRLAVRPQRPGLARALFWLLVALAVAILVQGLMAGAFVLGGLGDPYRIVHVAFGHALELGMLAMFVLAFAARDREAGWVGVALFVLASLQNGTIAGTGLVRALHVLDAFLIVGGTAWLLGRRLPRAAAR